MINNELASTGLIDNEAFAQALFTEVSLAASHAILARSTENASRTRRIMRLGVTVLAALGRSMAPEFFVDDQGYRAEVERKASIGVAEGLGIDQSEVASLIEERGYVCPPRKFAEQVEDYTRTNEFSYGGLVEGSRRRMTEHAGLVSLDNFLGRRHGNRAKSMRENLTFIGEKEYAEASKGIAEYWKSYLDADPDRQLCLLTLISGGGSIKSDKYFMERALEHFTDEELEKYKGRLLVDVDKLSAPAEKVRVALLDDWIISGQQMGGAYSTAYHNLPAQYKDKGVIEVNLITVSKQRVEQGMTYYAGGAGYTKVPIKGYFLARDAEGPVSYPESGAYISGTHSTVDFDFRDAMRDMGATSWIMDTWLFDLPIFDWLDVDVAMPELTRIAGSYKDYTSRPQYNKVKQLTESKEGE